MKLHFVLMLLMAMVFLLQLETGQGGPLHKGAGAAAHLAKNVGQNAGKLWKKK